MYIKLEDLKKWRAERIAEGNCDYDEMEALAHFINTVEAYEETEILMDCSDRR
jgi:hypothetical protein